MGPIGDTKEPSRWPLFRSASAHTHGVAGSSGHTATAHTPPPPGQQPSPSNASSSPLVAWPEEGVEPPQPLAPRALQPRRRAGSVHASAATAASAAADGPGAGRASSLASGWDAHLDDGALLRSKSARLLPNNSRFGQELTGGDKARLRSSGSVGSAAPAPQLGASGSTGGGGGGASEAMAAAPVAAAADCPPPRTVHVVPSQQQLRPERLRAGPSRCQLQAPAPPSGGGEEHGSGGPRVRSDSRGVVTPDSPSRSPRVPYGMAGRVSGASSPAPLLPSAAASSTAPDRPGTGSAAGAEAGSSGAAPHASGGTGLAAGPRAGRRAEVDRGVAGQLGAQPSAKLCLPSDGGGGGGMEPRRRRHEVPQPPSSSGGCVELPSQSSLDAPQERAAGDAATERCPHQPQEQPPPPQLLRSRSSRRHSRWLVSDPSGSLGGSGGGAAITASGGGGDSDASTDVDPTQAAAVGRGSAATPAASPAGTASAEQQQQQQHPVRVAAPPRHPPTLRVSIGLLPSPLHSPAASPAVAAAVPPASASSRVPSGSGGGGGGQSPTGGSVTGGGGVLTPAPRSDRVTPPSSPPAVSATVTLAASGSSFSPSTAAATAKSACSAPSPQSPQHLDVSQTQPSQPSASSPPPPPPLPLPSLPSFLGAPVVNPHPPHVLAHAGGPGALGPSLSRPTSGADRSHSSTSLGGLQAVPPQPPPQPQAQPQDSSLGAGVSGSSRTRLLHVSSTNSRRISSGRDSLRKNGSYFWVREAVPEAVLDNIPGMQTYRGLPQPPQHPGAVPEDGPAPPPPPLLQSLAAAAAAATGQPTSQAAAGGSATLLQISSSGASLSGGGGNVSVRRRGLDLPGTAAAPAVPGGAAGSQTRGLVSASGSSQTGSVSWLRRSEAMLPADLLPIPPAPPPLALDHLHPATGSQTASPRRSFFGRENGDAGAGGGGGAAGGGLSSAGRCTSPAGWRRSADLQAEPVAQSSPGGIAVEELFEPSSPSLAEVPSAAAMAAAAVASTLGAGGSLPSTSCDGGFGPSDVQPLHSPRLGSPAAVLSYVNSVNGGGGGGPSSPPCDSESTSPAMAKVPSWPAPAPPLVPRQSFRSQSKRLTNFAAGLGLGGGSSAAAGVVDSSAATAGDQTEIFALLGFNRMPSSVLTASACPNSSQHSRSGSGAVTADVAVHGVRDPNYGVLRSAVIPEATPPPSDPSTLPSNSFLLGNSRMGSSVFSPPGGSTKLSAALRPTRTSEASRAAMPDLLALSRRVGSNTVVGPDGRTVHIPTHGSSVSDGQLHLELPPPEALVAAVNGHRPLSPSEWSVVGAAGGASGTGRVLGGGGGLIGSISRRTMGSRASPPSRGRPSLGAILSLGGVRHEGLTAPSSDGSEDHAPSDGARRARSFRFLAGALHGTAPRGSSSSGGGGTGGGTTGGGGTSHGGGVPELIRHLSAPARRFQHASSGSLTAGGYLSASHGPGQGLSRSGTGAHPAGHKSFFTAGINFFKRAFSLRAPGSEGATWHPEQAPRTRSVGGSVQPLWASAEPTPSGRGTGSGSGEFAVAGSLYYNPEGGAAVAASSGMSGSALVPSVTASTRRMCASQKSFVKHSAVLGWVQQLGREDEAGLPAVVTAAAAAGVDSDADGEGLSAAATRAAAAAAAAATAAAAAASAGSMARLHSLQSLMAAGGNTLTCDAVVAFNDADGGAVARRRPVGHGSSRRRGGGHGPTSDDTSEDVGGTGTGTGSGSGGDVGPPVGAAAAAGWLAPTPSATGDGSVPAAAPSASFIVEDGRRSTTSQSLASTRPSWWGRPPGTPPMSAASAASAASVMSAAAPTAVAMITPPSPVAESHPSSRLLARLGSNLLGRSGRRSGLVVPVSGPDVGSGDSSYSLPSGDLADVRTNSSGVSRLRRPGSGT